MKKIDSECMKTILEILEKNLKIKILDLKDPFESLILTILSQNTNDNNRDHGWERLVKKFKKITPEVLANADVLDIEEAIKVAGLQKVKSIRIKNVSSLILNEFNGDMNLILKRPLKEARRTLLDIKGIGFKTADILLLFYSNYLTLPIDTHITRLSKRMGFADEKDKYETIRKKLQSVIPRNLDHYIKSHLYIIELGRQYCKAGRPLCEKCPISKECPKIILKKPKKRKKK
ncbi:MAG: endonuclease III domain-containing protein [Candidatus Helarchaeota archaeon]